MATIISFVFFTALVGVLTWLITRNGDSASSDGYFLAGRSLTAGVIAGSLLLTNLSTEQLVGLNGDAFRDGLCVMAWEVVAGASLVLMAIFFLPRYLAGGIATVPQFLANRYDESTRTITNGIFIIAYMLILLPIVLYTGATALVDMLGVQELLGLGSRTAAIWVTVWLIGILGSIYAVFGGLRTVAVSDTLNGFGLLVGGVMIAWYGLSAVNDGGVMAAINELSTSHPEKFRSLGTNDNSVPWHTLFTGVLLLNLFYWTTNQQIIQRTFAASTLAEGQKGVLLAATFKIFAPIILVVPGIVAFHLDSKGELFEEAKVAEMRKAVIDKAEAEGKSLTDEEIAKNLHKTKGDKAYGTLVGKFLPQPLTGFFAAVVVGAILSSFNSALNATATLFSLGIYRRFGNPDASDQQTVRSGRIFGTVIAVASMSVAPLLIGQDSIFGYLQKMNGLYFIPIFAVVIVGMLTKHVPAIAANIALVVGLLSIATVYFVPSVETAFKPVHGFHFLGGVFLMLVVLMLVIGAMKPRVVDESDAENAEAAAIDLTPWPLAKPAGISLVVLIGLIYAYFAF